MITTPADSWGFFFVSIQNLPNGFFSQSREQALKSEETLRYEIRDEDVDDYISD